jgi:hypothetical protein
MGMLVKNVYGGDYRMSRAALSLSKNGTSEAIFRFNV